MSEGDLTAAKSSFDGPVKTITFSGRTIRVCYTVDAAVANAWMDAHFPSLSCNVPTCDDAPMTVIGLDAEWKPRFHRTVAPPRPALVQVSDRDGNVLLIHVCHMKGAFPVRVSAALAHPRVLKVGVGVLDDANKIHVLSRSPVRACVDLVESLLCHLGTEEALPGRSLFKLAAHYLSVGNWKTKSLTMSNWEKYPLSESQIQYAALDAWVSAAMYDKMQLPPSIVEVCLRSSSSAAITTPPKPQRCPVLPSPSPASGPSSQRSIPSRSFLFTPVKPCGHHLVFGGASSEDDSRVTPSPCSRERSDSEDTSEAESSDKPEDARVSCVPPSLSSQSKRAKKRRKRAKALKDESDGSSEPTVSLFDAIVVGYAGSSKKSRRS